MQKMVEGVVREGRVVIDNPPPLPEGTRVRVLLDVAEPRGRPPTLLQQGKYRYPDGMSMMDFREFRDQLNAEWEAEIDEFFPRR